MNEDNFDDETPAPQPPAPPNSEPGKLRFEEWVTKKGHDKGTGLVLSRCGRVHNGWRDETMLSEAEYDAGCEAAQKAK